jgi:hypothetical protein
MLGVAYFLLDAIAAVVVGGTGLFGGRVGIGNTIVGLFVLRVLDNGLDDVKIDNFLKILIRGLNSAGRARQQYLCGAPEYRLRVHGSQATGEAICTIDATQHYRFRLACLTRSA